MGRLDLLLALVDIMARLTIASTSTTRRSWGTEIRLCSSPILMQQPVEQVAAVHLGSMIPTDDGQVTGSVQCLKSEGAVWTMPVVVLGVDPQDVLQVPRPTISSRSRQPARTVPIHRPAKAFALGGCTGVCTTSASSDRNTSSKAPQNLASGRAARNAFSALPAPAAGCGPAGRSRRRTGWRSPRPDGPCGCRKPRLSHAAWAYSRMSPPSRSSRTTRSLAAGSGSGTAPSGGA
jgi:hypothetical protein